MAFIDSLGPGTVAVIATGADTRTAYWGELFSASAKGHGAVGAVCDGPVRDVAKIRASAIDVFAPGSRPVDFRARMRVVGVGRARALRGRARRARGPGRRRRRWGRGGAAAAEAEVARPGGRPRNRGARRARGAARRRQPAARSGTGGTSCEHDRGADGSAAAAARGRRQRPDRETTIGAGEPFASRARSSSRGGRAAARVQGRRDGPRRGHGGDPLRHADRPDDVCDSNTVPAPSTRT